jgi:hypothetical protein
LNLSLAPDISQITFQFAQPPFINMELDSSLRVGPQIPMPIRNLIDSTVRGACDGWVVRNLVQPNSITLKLDRLRRKSVVTDEDVKYATKAALEGARRSKQF